MKKLFILLFACVSVLGRAQAPEVLPQVFSPNAAELGKYGKVPVSYFNGLPNISIPLTELKAKDYTLPIYLTYYAGGNKPDQHPGWVGQGWTLHAGGCINRIVHGGKDEENASEYNYKWTKHPGLVTSVCPGYFYHAEDIQTKDWTDVNNLNDVLYGNYQAECEPDESLINVEGIQASFFFIGRDRIRIVSQSNAHFSATYTLASSSDEIILYSSPSPDSYDETVPLFDYIKTICITADDGTKYTFGGELDAIEFSFSYSPGTLEYNSFGIGAKGHWNSTANTWNLTSIERPNGETISFEYVRAGMPISVHDIHYEYRYQVLGSEDAPTILFSSFEKNNVSGHPNLNYTVLNPSYLHSIKSKIAGDEIMFHVSETTEMDYNITRETMQETVPLKKAAIDTLLSRNYYQPLLSTKNSK